MTMGTSQRQKAALKSAGARRARKATRLLAKSYRFENKGGAALTPAEKRWVDEYQKWAASGW